MSTELTIDRNRVVQFHYTIRNETGAVLETTGGGEPQAILYGHGNVLRGVEEALHGRVSGERLTVTLAPADAYGERHEDRLKRVSKKYLPVTPRLKPGMTVQLNTEQGPRSVTVVKVGNKVVDVDLNHPFAGQAVSFDLEIVDVRDATREELAHGHVHGPGGHPH